MLRTEEDRRSAKLDRMKKHLGTTKAAAHAHHIFNVSLRDCEPVPTPATKQDETSKLEKRVNELTKQVEKLNQKSWCPVQDTFVHSALDQKQGDISQFENRIVELTKQVGKLSQGRRENEGAMKKDCLAVSSNNERRPYRAPGMPRAWFCFKCGQDNHIAVHCSNEPNPTLVRSKNVELRERQDKFLAQQAISPFSLKLIAAPAVGHPGAATPSDLCPNELVKGAETKESIMTQTMGLENISNHSIPPGLVGPRAASVFLEGLQCESIMDTGSQVTTISELFHRNHLSHLPIHPIHALLEIEGAGVQHVPYLGYIEVNVTFPQPITGREENLDVLVLVVPECQFNSRIPLLIGTNVLLPPFEHAHEQGGPEFIRKLDPKTFAMIFQHIAQTQEIDNYKCSVRLHGKGSVTIAPKQKCWRPVP